MRKDDILIFSVLCSNCMWDLVLNWYKCLCRNWNILDASSTNAHDTDEGDNAVQENSDDNDSDESDNVLQVSST